MIYSIREEQVTLYYIMDTLTVFTDDSRSCVVKYINKIMLII
jgi:hypothetical protein